MKRTALALAALGIAVLSAAGSAEAQTCITHQCPPGTSGGSSDAPIAEVCFFAEADFKGLRFCETGSRTVSSVPARWRHNIQSIMVGERTSVRVCPAEVLQGDCALIDGNIRKLEPGLADHVYSYDIRQAY